MRAALLPPSPLGASELKRELTLVTSGVSEGDSHLCQQTHAGTTRNPWAPPALAQECSPECFLDPSRGLKAPGSHEKLILHFVRNAQHCVFGNSSVVLVLRCFYQFQKENQENVLLTGAGDKGRGEG